jgi:twitching motility two-component system response regulator PilG
MESAITTVKPKLTGLKVLVIDDSKTIRRTAETLLTKEHNKVFKQIPVIMLSSKDGLFDRARGRIVGSEHYLTKPFTKDELLGAIEAHVGK